jgi:predicted TIM-barrel fold metal-dependent hydrolase
MQQLPPPQCGGENLGPGNSRLELEVESIRPFVLQTIEAFGVSRCMFASNFPVDKLYSDFDTLYTRPSRNHCGL